MAASDYQTVRFIHVADDFQLVAIDIDALVIMLASKFLDLANHFCFSEDQLCTICFIEELCN